MGSAKKKHKNKKSLHPSPFLSTVIMLAIPKPYMNFTLTTEFRQASCAPPSNTSLRVVSKHCLVSIPSLAHPAKCCFNWPLIGGEWCVVDGILP